MTPLSPEVISRQATINIGKNEFTKRGGVLRLLFDARAVRDGAYVVTLSRNLYRNSYIVILGTCQALLT